MIETVICKICNKELKNATGLAGHIGRGHKTNMKDYTIKFTHNGVIPTCQTQGCTEHPTWVKRGSFYRKYCKKHANITRSEWSKANGFGAKIDAGWKKGLTKETHSGIARQARKMTLGKTDYFERIQGLEAKLDLKITSNYEDYSSQNYKTRFINIFCPKCQETSKRRMVELKAGYGCKICIKNDYKAKFVSLLSKAKKSKLEILTRPESYIENRKAMLHLKCKLCGLETLKAPAYLNNEHRCKCSQIISEVEFLSRIEIFKDIKKLKVVSSYDFYLKNGLSKANLKIVCLKCNTTQRRTLVALGEKWCGCRKCNKQTSTNEKEVLKFVRDLGFSKVDKTRELISPYEVDVFVEERQIAIEYNGLYWHSDASPRNIKFDYHSNKTQSCKDKSVQLIHIFSDEWIKKREVIESMLSHRLGKTKTKIFARKTKVREVERDQSRAFFDKTHIAGNAKRNKAFGLYHNNELVSALSLRKPMGQKYKGYIEIARFANELNTVVTGGFQKLLKHVVKYAKEEGYKGILTYADLRFGTGQVYEKAGFEYIGKTAPDYWYTDFKNRYSRTICMAKNGKSERQIAEEKGLARIYGCGSNIYTLAFL